jgi:hypothetical protein
MIPEFHGAFRELMCNTLIPRSGTLVMYSVGFHSDIVFCFPGSKFYFIDIWAC